MCAGSEVRQSQTHKKVTLNKDSLCFKKKLHLNFYKLIAINRNTTFLLNILQCPLSES